MSDFFDESGDKTASENTSAFQPVQGNSGATSPGTSSGRRRRTRTILLVAIGSATALGVYSCMMAADNQNDGWNGADNGQIGPDGQPVAGQQVAQSRPGYSSWYFLPRMGFFGGGGGRSTMPGASSGFAASPSGAGGVSTGTSGGTTSTGTSRGGFGSIGRAFSGIS